MAETTKKHICDKCMDDYGESLYPDDYDWFKCTMCKREICKGCLCDRCYFEAEFKDHTKPSWDIANLKLLQVCQDCCCYNHEKRIEY